MHCPVAKPNTLLPPYTYMYKCMWYCGDILAHTMKCGRVFDICKRVLNQQNSNMGSKFTPGSVVCIYFMAMATCRA